jgi:hypothetical protein
MFYLVASKIVLTYRVMMKPQVPYQGSQFLVMECHFPKHRIQFMKCYGAEMFERKKGL